MLLHHNLDLSLLDVVYYYLQQMRIQINIVVATLNGMHNKILMCVCAH